MQLAASSSILPALHAGRQQQQHQAKTETRSSFIRHPSLLLPLSSSIGGRQVAAEDNPVESNTKVVPSYAHRLKYNCYHGEWNEQQHRRFERDAFVRP